MSLQGQPPLARQDQLRRLIRSLSKVSEVETRQVRARIERESQFRNRNRRKREVQVDGLLRQRRVVLLPSLLSSNRLFESKDRKIESLKERYIDSEAYLKRANFEYKKIELKKQDVAHKQHKQYNKDRIHASAAQLQIKPNPNHKTQLYQDPFATPNKHMPQEASPVLIERLKTTVDSSHKEMKQLYESHVRQVASLPFRKRVVSDHLKSDEISVLSKESQMSSGPQVKPTKSVILLPSQRRPKKAVDELIRMSSFRSRQNQALKQRTSKQQQELEHLHNAEIMNELHAGIEQDNKLKQSIVLGHLKKLLYGDRRGRFIQDSTFRTRLRGQYSDQYMNVVAEQQNILGDFKGSYFNRRNLVQKFANILGTLRTHSSQEEHEMVLM